jgi:signal transduction histidine kinase/ligand-binding sensor domain-containing protein
MSPGLPALLIALSAIDSTPRPLHQLVHTTWTPDDGAPTEIRALAQTGDGYLWLGTVSGLVRFDGVRFVPLSAPSGDSIPTGGVRSLLEAHDGSLWIVWRNGAVSHLSGGRLISYGEHNGLPPTLQLTQSSAGVLIAATVRGLARFNDGKWETFGRDWGFPGTKADGAWFDRGDTLWVEAEDRVVYLPTNERRFIDPGMRLVAQSAQTAFAQDKDGAIWMAEVYRSAHTIPRLGHRASISEVKVGAWTLLIDRKGSLWIGTLGDGLRRVLDPTRIRGRRIAQFGPEAEQFSEKDGLLSNVVSALLEDDEGNIWVSTVGGLERFREGAFTPSATPGGVRQRLVVATRDSSVWTTAFNTFELIRLGPRNRDQVHTPVALINLAEDSSGTLWSARLDGIFRIQGGRVTPSPLSDRDVQHLVEVVVDSLGTIWLFDEELGLLRLGRSGLVRVAPIGPPTRGHVVMFSDREGRIWVGQENRVALYDHGKVSLFTQAQGMTLGGVRAFFQDRGGGQVWASGDRGLSRFEGDRFRTLPERQGVPGRSVYGIAADDGGGWWIVTRDGVLLVPPGAFDRALADSDYVVPHRRFDRRDGLGGMIPRWTYGRWVTRSMDGRIWVATDGGVANVNPRDLPPSVPPTVLIEGVRVDGREAAAAEGTSIRPESRDVEIDYTATSLSIPERVQFRYRLEGEDQTWHEVGSRRRAYYTGLAPGRYTFRVIASNSDGVWNEAGAGAAWKFRVLPAWYQTLVFRSGVVVLIGVLGAAAAALVQRRRHLRSQETLKGQYEATLAERARIAQEMHDTLLQGFTGITIQLRAIQRIIGVRPEEGVAALDGALSTADVALRDARNSIWDMRAVELEGRDLPEALEGAVRSVTGQASATLEFTVLGDRRPLTPEVATTALRIGREAVLNALKHAEAKRIQVQLDYGRLVLTLEVQDDGRGMTPGAAEQAASDGHLGLAGMRARASKGAGTLHITSEPGQGTIVRASLPID